MGSIVCVQGQGEGNREPLVLVPISEGIPQDVLESFGAQESQEGLCQEIGLVAFMFFFELFFLYVSSSISFYVSLTNLFSIISFPYLLITRDIQDEGKARFRFY